MEKKTAILLGASGLTGNYLLQLLLASKDHDQVLVFSRRPLEIEHPKLSVIICDLLQLKEVHETFKAHEVYCCIGTTQKKTPDKDNYREIDYGIPVSAAELCKENGIKTFIVISSMGANPNSRIFYNRTKGEMERDVLQQDIEQTFIVRPSIIEGNRNEHRLAEKIGLNVFKALQLLFVGPLRKLRSIHAEKIAKSMLKLAEHGFPKSILLSDEIEFLANKTG